MVPTFFLVLWTLLFSVSPCQARLLSLPMLYRFSPQFIHLHTLKTGHNLSQFMPPTGTALFFNLLHTQDNARHDSRLSTYPSLFFSEGNKTIDYGAQFGWLHYALLDLGTPNASFLVALDTGSDLLWVPCECKQCASTSASRYGLAGNLNVYSPTNSKTSKRITCSSNLCDMSYTCKDQDSDCPYSVRYLSDNTSTSGMLVEDVIYLTSGNHHGTRKSVTTPVIFGCGKFQSGSFLDGGAPDGLLGLGLGKISVPNILANAGLVKNSFSMCFQPDNSGRIFFGDKGASHQQTTPFLPINGTYLVYMVALEQVVVGSVLLDTPRFETLVDSGTSFTYLPNEAYSALTAEFDKQVKETRLVLPNIPWEFCYDATKSQNSRDIPSVSFIFNGGGDFSIYSPLVGLYDGHGNLVAFCLGLLQGQIAILGQNFMTSYQLVFDQEELKLGWSRSNCYQLEEDGPPSPTMQETETSLKISPSPAVGDQQPSPSPAVSPITSHHVAGSGGESGAGGTKNKGQVSTSNQQSSLELGIKIPTMSVVIVFILGLLGIP